MEMKPSDVVVVSAFGRSDWLAAELSAAGMSVKMIDVTSQLGVWPPEDIEGPFGFFMLEKYQQSFLECLSHQDQLLTVENGFAVWSEDGPIEMKSPITRYRFAKLGFHPKIWDVLNQEPSESSVSINSLENLPFQEIWPLCLAYQVASTTYQPNRSALGRGDALPLLNTFMIRHGTRAGLENSLEWVKTKGVEVITKSEILDVALGDRKNLTGLELKGRPSGVFRFDQLVWALTSEETYYLNEKIGRKLFSKGKVESTWSWVRYRLHVKPCPEIQIVPQHFCLIEDIMAPWTHENMALIYKTQVDENLDAWVRLPTVQRFNKEYLKTIGDRVTGILSNKIPLCEPEVQSYPQEYYYTYKELGAPRFPIFESRDSSKRKSIAYHNLYRDGVEVWNNFTKDCQFIYQSKLREKIIHSWQQKQLKQQKAKEQERD